jgi:hypothetical protein
VRLRGRVARLYGGNAQGLALQVGALLDDDLARVRAESGLDEDELRSLFADLERFRHGYRDVVHHERRLSEMEPLYDAWMATRDRALSMLAVAEQHAVHDPRARRQMAQWSGYLFADRASKVFGAVQSRPRGLGGAPIGTSLASSSAKKGKTQVA